MVTPNRTSGALLAEQISKALHNRNGNIAKSVDLFFNEDGRLEELIKESIINYALRRLVHSAQSLIDQNNEIINDENSLETIRQFLYNCTDLTDDSPERPLLEKLIFNSIKASKQKLTKSHRNLILKQFQENGNTSCYMCGISVDFESNDNDNSATVEHVFPREFGGDTESHNFSLACKDCNTLKDNYINYGDYHYERISTKYNEGHSNFTRRLFKKESTIAIWTQNQHVCSSCRMPASSVGRLNVRKRNNTDGWHFLNIETTCNNPICNNQ